MDTREMNSNPEAAYGIQSTSAYSSSSIPWNTSRSPYGDDYVIASGPYDASGIHATSALGFSALPRNVSAASDGLSYGGYSMPPNYSWQTPQQHYGSVGGGSGGGGGGGSRRLDEGMSGSVGPATIMGQQLPYRPRQARFLGSDSSDGVSAAAVGVAAGVAGVATSAGIVSPNLSDTSMDMDSSHGTAMPRRSPPGMGANGVRGWQPQGPMMNGGGSGALSPSSLSSSPGQSSQSQKQSQSQSQPQQPPPPQQQHHHHQRRGGTNGGNRDEFDGPHQFLPRPTAQYLAQLQERELPHLPTNLLVQEQDSVLARVNERLAQCAYDFVARYQFPIPLTQDMRPVARPQDREWHEWVQLLKRLATKRRIPARVLYNGQIKQLVTVLENSLEMRHAPRHQSRPLKDDRNILQLISAGIQVAKILRDAPAMDYLDRLYVATDQQIQERSGSRYR